MTLQGLKIRRRTVARLDRTAPTGWSDSLQQTRIHLMDASQHATPSITLCGIKIEWQPFAQTRQRVEAATCRRCLRKQT